MESFVLCEPPPGVVSDSPANAGFVSSEIHALLDEIRRLTGRKWEIQGWGEDPDVMYERALDAAAYQKVHVVGVFGESGEELGQGVPALFVVAEAKPVGIYPHRDGGDLVTIRDYLDANVQHQRKKLVGASRRSKSAYSDSAIEERSG